MERKLLYKIIQSALSLPKIVVCLFLFSNVSNGQVNTFSPLTIYEKVIPNNYATTSGTGSFLGPITNSARTYQMLIAASQLTDLVGKDLISLSFRIPSSSTAAWPTADTTFSNYDIYLSNSVNPADRSLTFAQNVVGTQTQVRSGSLVIPANALTFGSTPNSFSFDIAFSNPWNYVGGNLLVEIRHTGSDGTSRAADAALTSSSGYGTLFSACWLGSYTGTSTTTQGNFCAINLKADDMLKIDDFNSAKISVYPNPASQNVYVEADTTINRIVIFNIMGQKVSDESVNGNKHEIVVSNLSNGAYLLQIETEKGIKSTKFVKN